MAKIIFLFALFSVAQKLRYPDAPYFDYTDSFSKSGVNFAAVLLQWLFLIPYLISTAISFIHIMGKNPAFSKLSVRSVGYILILAGHLVAVHTNSWKAMFLPVQIFMDSNTEMSSKIVTGTLSSILDCMTLITLASFLDYSQRPSG